MRWHNLSRISERVEAHHEPGRFVTLFDYEWTKQPNAGGHIDCYFGTVADTPFFDSRHPESDTYEKLWARLDAWREDEAFAPNPDEKGGPQKSFFRKVKDVFT